MVLNFHLQRHKFSFPKDALFARVQKSTCAKATYVIFEYNNWDLSFNSVFADPNNIPNKINHATHACVCVCVILLLQKAYAMHFI